MHTAKDNPILVHPEDDWQSLFEVAPITNAISVQQEAEIGETSMLSLPNVMK